MPILQTYMGCIDFFGKLRCYSSLIFVVPVWAIRVVLSWKQNCSNPSQCKWGNIHIKNRLVFIVGFSDSAHYCIRYYILATVKDEPFPLSLSLWYLIVVYTIFVLSLLIGFVTWFLTSCLYNITAWCIVVVIFSLYFQQNLHPSSSSLALLLCSFFSLYLL